MLSYVSRRRRWWKLLRTLDTTIELSEPTRVELLLELSGLTRQVIKACAEDSKHFDAVSRVLVDHYSGVHLCQGKTLGGSSAASSRSNFRYTGKGSRPKGKSKGFTRRAYPAVEEGDEDEDSWWEDSWEGYHVEAYPAASYDDDDDDDPELVPHEDQDYEEFELDEPEAGHRSQFHRRAR